MIPKLSVLFMSTIKYNKKDVARFISKIRINEVGCFEWTASLSKKGYGHFSIFRDGRHIINQAHRVSYEIVNGSILDDGCVCHRCDNRKCVNPYHLFLGTIQDNNKDRDNKGRQFDRSGENNGMSKLDWKKVREIRCDYNTGNYKQKTLAKKHGVTRELLNMIINNKIWYDEKYIRTYFYKSKLQED